MRRSFDVWFASSNVHKYTEAREILEKFGIRLGYVKFNAVEIQSDSLLEIARKKSLDAYQKFRKPIIIEDDGIFIKSLNGFPGPYSSYVYDTIGNDGVVKLVKKDRSAKFWAVISYCEGKRPVQFVGITNGSVPKRPRGGGWGYDPIFVPKGKTETYGEMKEKNELSHRSRGLKKFASWYLRRPQSSD
jgi:XTP/dITP diphosphohydrolase